MFVRRTHGAKRCDAFRWYACKSVTTHQGASVERVPRACATAKKLAAKNGGGLVLGLTVDMVGGSPGRSTTSERS